MPAKAKRWWMQKSQCYRVHRVRLPKLYAVHNTPGRLLDYSALDYSAVWSNLHVTDCLLAGIYERIEKHVLRVKNGARMASPDK